MWLVINALSTAKGELLPGDWQGKLPRVVEIVATMPPWLWGALGWLVLLLILLEGAYRTISRLEEELAGQKQHAGALQLNEVLHKNMLWRGGEDGPEGPFCAVHRQPLFYRNFLGKIEPNPDGDSFLGSNGAYVCPVDDSEAFWTPGARSVQIADLKAEVTALLRSKLGAEAVEPLRLKVDMLDSVLCVKAHQGHFLVVSNLVLTSEMKRRGAVKLRLRVRLQDKGLIWPEPVPAPGRLTEAVYPEAALAPPLAFPIEIPPRGTRAGHVAFFLSDIEWGRFAPGGLDSLSGENLVMELQDLLTGDKSQFPIDRRWSEWKLVRLNGVTP